MNKKLRDQFLADFPTLFESGREPRFECGSGWAGIIRECFQRLLAAALPPDYKIVTVKEKYGRLNIWGYSEIAWKPDAALDILDAAESESYHTCERCGSTRGVRLFTHDGWDQVGCYPCRQMVKAGWTEDAPEFEQKSDVRCLLDLFSDRFNREVRMLLPPGTEMRMVLSTKTGRSRVVVKTSDGRVYGI